MSYTPLVTDGSGPSPVSTGTQSFTGAKTFSGGVQGPGTVPLGAIIPVVNSSPITGGGYIIPPSGTVDTNGWQLCDGVAIPVGNTLIGNTPNLSDGRYLRGSTVSGTIGGSNTFTPAGINTSSNVPALGLSFSGSSTSYTVSVPAHYHGIGTGAALSAAGQTLGSSAIALASGSAAGQTFSGNSGNAGAHDHGMTASAHMVRDGSAGLLQTGPYADWAGYWVAAVDHPHTINHTHAPSGVTGTTDIAHTHAPSVVTGTIGLVTGGQNGNLAFSASGSNTPSGSITGTATAAAQAFTGTSANNEPQYLNVRYLIRVK